MESLPSVKGILIRNANIHGCLSAYIDRSTYHDIEPINALYSVVVTDCNSQGYGTEIWQWSPHNHLMHMSTGLCLSVTHSNNAVLLPCSKLNWRQRWFCDGQAIVQPHTLMRLTAVAEDLEAAAVGNMKSVKNGIYNQPDRERGRVIVVLQSKSPFSDKNQQWKAQNSDGTDAIICPLIHKISKCYFQPTEGPLGGWVRCDMHGYLAAGIQYETARLNHLSQIVCCALENSRDEKMKKDKYQKKTRSHTYICEHQQWWVSEAQEKLTCKKGSFLRGLKLRVQPKAGPSIIMGECCWPTQGEVTSDRYAHCYVDMMKSSSIVPLNSCLKSGYYITSVVKTYCGQVTCSHMITCCTV